MEIIKTDISPVVIVEPRVFADERGYFFESFVEAEFNDKLSAAIGRRMEVRFVQDNESRSLQGVVRGLHYQMPPHAQSKLVRAVEGRIIDVAVDIRRGSPTFGKYVAVELSGENHRQLFVPRGFAHGFAVLSPTAIVAYKCDNYYDPAVEGSVAFDDPALAIDWRLGTARAILSPKDMHHPSLADAKLFDYNEDLYPVW